MGKFNHSAATEVIKEACEHVEDRASSLDQPWEWLSEEEDEDTRSYVAWFEAEVEEAYESEEKIRGCSVDMAWCVQHPQCRFHEVHLAGSTTHSSQNEGEVDKVEEEALSDGTDTDKPLAPGEAPTPLAQGTSLKPVPPPGAQCRRGADRPYRRRHSELVTTDSADSAEIEDGEQEKQPTPPSSPQQPESAKLSKLRHVVFQDQSQRMSTSVAITRGMAGPPAIALRKGDRPDEAAQAQKPQ